MNLNMEWYFTVSVLGLCAVALAMRAGNAAFKLMACREQRKAPSKRSFLGNWGQWLAACLVERSVRRSRNWYCFFYIPDLIGERRKEDRKEDRVRITPRLRLRARPPGPCR
jgi:hypothetical protein